jgi:hypothetical protein
MNEASRPLTVKVSGRSATTDAPRPPEKHGPDHEHHGAENGVHAMTTHSRTVHYVRTLRNPHESDEAQHDTDNSANPHD